MTKVFNRSREGTAGEGSTGAARHSNDPPVNVVNAVRSPPTLPLLRRPAPCRLARAFSQVNKIRKLPRSEQHARILGGLQTMPDYKHVLDHILEGIGRNPDRLLAPPSPARPARPLRSALAFGADL